MEVKAYSRGQRVSPKKARLICREFVGMPAKAALMKLEVQPQKTARLVYKLLKSAIANAENNFRLKGDDLKIIRLTADKGPSLKRMRPRGRGRADRITKPTSHLTIILLGEAQTAAPKVETKAEAAVVPTTTPEAEVKPETAKKPAPKKAPVKKPTVKKATETNVNTEETK